MANSKKADPSALFSDSISVFTKSATKVFNEFQNQARGDIARAEADTRQVRNERDEALKAIQESKKETQRFKDENMELKARLKEAELTISHHIENYALLQRETNQWKDQAKNWQEHFLRVEQERCSLASRMDELVTERLIISPVTPKLPTTTKPIVLSTTNSSIPKPPAYHSAAPASSSRDLDSGRSPITAQNSRSTKSVKRKVPSQNELPPYTEVAQTLQTAKVSAPATNSANRATRKETSSWAKKVAPPPPALPSAETSKESSEPQQISIRRVRAIVEVKQEEESDEELPPPESPEESTSSRRSHKARRARQIIDDDDYVPDDASQLGLNEDAEDDELMIGAGDDLSFDINTSSSTRASASKTSPNKKRKLGASTNSKPKARRKI